MVQYDMPPAVALNDTALDKRLFIEVDHLGAHIPGGAHPTERRDQRDQIPVGGPQESGQNDQRDQPGQQETLSQREQKEKLRFLKHNYG